MNKLDKWKKLASEATPGPWVFDSGNSQIYSHCEALYRFPIVQSPDLMRRPEWIEASLIDRFPPNPESNHFPAPDDDAEFIAASREAVPVLIELLEIAIATLKTCERTVGYCVSDDEEAACKNTIEEALEVISKVLEAK